MMLKRFSFLLLFLFLTGCSSEVATYQGETLKIAIIGEKPVIREKDNIVLKSINFNDLEEMKTKIPYEFDAIIVRENLIEDAANGNYEDLFKDSGVPIFFMNAKKGYLVFTESEYNYGNFPDTQPNASVIGYFKSNVTGIEKGYAIEIDTIPFDTKNVSEIGFIYSEIFRLIVQIKEDNF